MITLNSEISDIILVHVIAKKLDQAALNILLFLYITLFSFKLPLSKLNHSVSTFHYFAITCIKLAWK